MHLAEDRQRVSEAHDPAAPAGVGFDQPELARIDARLKELRGVMQPRVQVAFVAAAIVLLLWMIAFLTAQPSPGTFFGTCWAAGRAAMHGQNPFGVYPQSAMVNMTQFGGIGPIHEASLNPPWLLPLLQAAAHLSLRNFCIVWTLTSLLLLATVALLIRRLPHMQMRQVVWLLFCMPTIQVLLAAQIYFPMFLLAAIAWLSLDRDDWLPAVAIGIAVAFRPTFLYWPAFLLLRRDTRLALRSFGIFAVVNLLPLPIYGPRIYGQWFAALHDDPHWASPMNIALPPTFRRLHAAPLGWAIAALLASAAAWYIWRHRPDRAVASRLALGCAVFCAPLAWICYLLPLMPGLVRAPWGRRETLAALFLMIPTAVPIAMAWRTSWFETALGACVYIVPIFTLVLTRIDPLKEQCAP